MAELIYRDKSDPRGEKSLFLLTSRFMSMLRKSPDGVLDLKSVAENLADKRRIYDITNVLEGIGLIEKISKSAVRWKGTFPISLSDDISDEHLKHEVAALQKHENTLESKIQCCRQSVKNILEDDKNKKKLYVLDSDMTKCFDDKVFLGVKASPGTRLEVPVREDSNSKFMIHIKSVGDPIQVFYLQESSKMKEMKNIKNSTSDGQPVERHVMIPNNLEQETDNRGNNDTEVLSEASVLLGDLCSDGTLSEQECDFLYDCDIDRLCSPFLRLSPTPTYSFNLADNEGFSDLFDDDFLDS